MGNAGSGGRRRQGSRRAHPPPPPPQPPHPEIAANRYVFAAATPYPSQYPNPNPNPPPYFQYPGYYPPQAAAAFDQHHHHQAGPPHMEVGNWVGGRYPCGPVMQAAAAPYVEHQKAVTIRNDVNIKKETLRVEADEDNPGKFLVSFTFDATLAGR